MDCATARRVLSASLDGGQPADRPGELAAHLDGCAGCRTWQEDAYRLARRLRLNPRPAPRPTPVLLASLHEARRPPAPRRLAGRVGLFRAGLVAAAAAQLACAGPALLAGHDRSAPPHVAHELGALGAAVAIGFLVAARRPARAVGMVTLVGVAALLLAVTAGLDLSTGRTTWLDEAPHLVVVAGWLLLRHLAVLVAPTADRPPSPRDLARRLSSALGRARAIARRRHGAALLADPARPAVAGGPGPGGSVPT
ncbi:MAG: hypothetical protein M0T71_01895, partial [Actinomycetota bacterium]|nr:hypothetical protein [Actinomycetota bacterium]